MNSAGRAAAGEAAIALFAKAPLPGRVKTRLVPPLTREEAARIARAALEDTARHIVPAVKARWTLYLDGAADDSLRMLAAEGGVAIVARGASFPTTKTALRAASPVSAPTSRGVIFSRTRAARLSPRYAA